MTKNFESELVKKYTKPKKIIIEESKYHREKIKLFFKKTNNKYNLFDRIKKKISSIKNAF